LGSKLAEASHGGRVMTKEIMPVFAFFRCHDIELEGGFVLAGHLVVDIPKGTKPKRRHQKTLSNIIKGLLRADRAEKLPRHNVACYGWDENNRPENFREIEDDDALMKAWADRCISVGIRVCAHDDGMMRLDSHLLRQIGLA
jgi:hypothetical protein